MKRYASIRFDRAIGPVNSAGAFVDSIVAGDAYLITREGDDVAVLEVASGIVLEVPWSRVISGSPAAPFHASLDRIEPSPMAEGGAFDALFSGEAPVIRRTHEPSEVHGEPPPRKGGWPKGKPRKPAAEGGEA